MGGREFREQSPLGAKPAQSTQCKVPRGYDGDGESIESNEVTPYRIDTDLLATTQEVTEIKVIAFFAICSDLPTIIVPARLAST